MRLLLAFLFFIYVAAKIPIQPVKKKKFTALPILAAAATTGTLMYPFDVIRTLKMANAGSGLSTSQLIGNFIQSHGIGGFFSQGVGPEIAKATYSRFLKFSIFPLVHAGMYSGRLPGQGTPLTKAIAALTTSIPESFSIMPLEVAKIQLQMDSTNKLGNSMFNALSGVVKERGMGGLGIGYTGIQLRQGAWTAAYFASLGSIRTKVLDVCDKYGFDTSSSSVKSACDFTSGFIAGVLGTCFNTPFDTIRSVVQKRAFSNPDIVAPTFLEVAREITAERGIGALYTGWSAKAIHLGGGGALMAALIPFYTRLYDRISGSDVTEE
jgi:solute carrier family 25 (mitochondrial 2-oxodicarboxylate transporter), member 21